MLLLLLQQVVRAMDKLGRPADKMRVKKVLEEFYRYVPLLLKLVCLRSHTCYKTAADGKIACQYLSFCMEASAWKRRHRYNTDAWVDAVNHHGTAQQRVTFGDLQLGLNSVLKVGLHCRREEKIKRSRAHYAPVNEGLERFKFWLGLPNQYYRQD